MTNNNRHQISGEIMIEIARSFLILFLLFLAVPINAHAGNWYEGGTLHKKTANEWHRASYRDRLATCADFISNVSTEATLDKLFINNMRLLKERSISLEICITKATDDPKLMTMKLSEVAVACVVLLNYNQ